MSSELTLCTNQRWWITHRVPGRRVFEIVTCINFGDVFEVLVRQIKFARYRLRSSDLLPLSQRDSR